MGKTYVSIAMATYNGETFIGEQLESIINQTRQPDEVVICDDGSTDATLDILLAFRRRVPFELRICQNETNLGVNKNFEKALSLCNGHIIFMSDQDDVWFENKIARVLEVFDQDPHLQVVVNDQINARSDLSHEGVSRVARRRARGYNDETFTTGCCTALRKEWLQFALPFGVDGFDIWTNRLSFLAGAWTLLDEPLQFYRRHGDNVSPGVGAEVEKIGPSDRPQRAHRSHQEWVDLWKRELSFSGIYADRLEKISQDSPALAKVASASSRGLRNKIEILEERLNLIELPLWRRPVRVLLMVVKGKYSSFRGMRSALMDIIR